MTDFLLELRSEEIPARMQAKARDDLARLFAAEMNARDVFVDLDPRTYATPRRLALISRNLEAHTEATEVEVKGPKVTAPEQAVEGFLRKTGKVRGELIERDGILFAVTTTPGRPMVEVLADAIPAVIRAFPWPKSMRWGDASISTDSLRWVRPLHGVVALLGEELVPVEIAGIASGYATLGHRFHHPGPITIGSAADYVDKLRACHVIVDHAEREAIIRDAAARLAAEAGLHLVEDEGLVAENAGLTEWPVPLLGRFDADFLSVPPEVIQLTARVNQKYFVCRGGEGKLASAFICTANIAAPDGGAKIVEGNRKVLAARLADARFFYEQDAKVRLEDHAAKLDRIVFHEKLGTVADKVDRVAKLARWLVEEGIVGESPSRLREGLGEGVSASDAPPDPTTPPPTPPASGRGELANLAERAARLAKADLVTGMVGEFPELQGVMGGYYAAAQGEDPRVAEAVRDHYKPVGQGDEVPTAPVTVAVSLADKLDTIGQFFHEGLIPTGSKDPFALRRAAIGVIQQITVLAIRVSIGKWLDQAIFQRLFTRYFSDPDVSSVQDTILRSRLYEVDGVGFAKAMNALGEISSATHRQRGEELTRKTKVAVELAIAFFADRLKVQQREAGVRHDLIDAVFALGGEDDLVRLLSRVRALQSFMATEDGANLLTGYRRAANILKKEGWTDAPPPASGRGPGGGPSLSTAPSGAGGAPTPNPLPQAGGGSFALSYTAEPAEDALIAALDSAEPRAAQAVAAEDFEGAMAALASLRAPIDAFFDKVTVNDPDRAKRSARLALLARVRDAVHTVADFAKIEG